MGKPRSRLIEYAGVTFPEVRGFTTEVHFGRQAKHLRGCEEFDPSRSEVTQNIQEIQNLIMEKAGTGQWITANKERIDFGRPIGISKELGSEHVTTTVGIVHYSKKGCHLVPGSPVNRRK